MHSNKLDFAVVSALCWKALLTDALQRGKGSVKWCATCVCKMCNHFHNRHRRNNRVTIPVLSASICRGKHRPTYTPSVDMGGFVVVVNAEKVIVTGSKASQKLYKRHTTGRPGSMKEETFEQLQAVRHADQARTVGLVAGLPAG